MTYNYGGICDPNAVPGVSRRRFVAPRKDTLVATTQPRSETMTMLAKAPTEPVDLAEVAVLLHPVDAVAIAKQPLLPRTVLRTPDGEVRVEQMVYVSFSALDLATLSAGVRVCLRTIK